MVKTTEVFRSGNHQAIRIPKEFQIDGTEVEIQRHGEAIILRPKRKSWTSLLESLEKFSEDFMEDGR
jgi:antitoxin VapB